jgi:hypothetical protein
LCGASKWLWRTATEYFDQKGMFVGWVVFGWVVAG